MDPVVVKTEDEEVNDHPYRSQKVKRTAWLQISAVVFYSIPHLICLYWDRIWQDLSIICSINLDHTDSDLATSVLSLVKVQQGSLLQKVQLVKISDEGEIVKYEEGGAHPLVPAWGVRTEDHHKTN